MMDIDVIIKSIKKLPPFPGLARQAMKGLDDPDASADQIISLVENDQFVLANALKLCNSAYYGPTRKVGSLRDGQVLLGNARLKEIILASTAVEYFQQENKGYGLARGDLWKHAVATGIISRIISHRVTESEPLSLFTAALFHDIGKVVLNVYVDRYFERIMGLVNTGDHSFPEAESSMIGINHAELGGKIAESWGFPDHIVRAIRLHHRPDETSADDVITPIIYLANIITLSVGIGLGRDGLSYRGRQEIMKRYGLKAKDLQGIMVDFYDQYSAAGDILQLA